MAKTKKLRNLPKPHTNLRESDISLSNTKENSKSRGTSNENTRGTSNENREDIPDQDLSNRDGSQEYVRPKGMDA